ncbi:aldo/keto reductase [Lentzea sp. HUAS TT2]|uniref:aldo/keto reductase n=1 Tax=Lentzea sp. HUAS TT2 TaxID=3447454 RepID=UPI003F71A9C5
MAGHSGVNLIDTADVYRKDDSERVIGLAIAGRRDEVVLASSQRRSRVLPD